MSKLLAYGGLFGLTTLSVYKFLTSKVNDRTAEVHEPPSTSIIMCTLNEEGFIEKALKSLEDQNVLLEYSTSFERIVVDSNSNDDTVAIAEDYGWTVLQAPRGKLNARHLGIEKAKGQVIVGVDADSSYGANWLNLVLRHFRNSRVVGVAGPRLAEPNEAGLLTGLSVWLSLVDLSPIAGLRMPGQSSAFRREAYYQVGGFNLDIDQQNVHEMVREEEIRFAWKLRQLGIVIVDLQAPVFTSTRRVMLARGKQYEKWRRERAKSERF